MSRADLHVHSTASDSSLTPEELIGLARELGLGAIAIADHDSVEGNRRATELAQGSPLRIVPAVEMSSDHQGHDIHILGYFLDTSDQRLLDFLSEMRRERLERVQASVRRLSREGVDVKGLGELLRSEPEKSVGRGILAGLLVQEGYADSMRDAFAKYLHKGGAGHVDKGMPAPDEVIDRLKSYGSVVVLAHPGISRVDSAIPGFIEAGLSGIEVFHPDHTEADTVRYAGMAERLGLVATGGSDCHGLNSDRGIRLGTITVPLGTLRALEALKVA